MVFGTIPVFKKKEQKTEGEYRREKKVRKKIRAINPAI